MKLTEKEKDQIVKRGAEAMSKIIERMSIEMGELEEENKKLKEDLSKVEEIKDRERIKLRERTEELELELREEKFKNELLRMKK